MIKEFVTKAQEVITSASQPAQTVGNLQVIPIRLLEALLEQKGGIATALINTVGANRNVIGARTRSTLITLLSASGANASQAQIARALLDIVNQARSLANKGGDAYVSTEYLLITLTASEDEAGRTLSSVDATPEVLSETLARLRPKAITPADPEGSLETLKKYGRDLTEVAREGKLDPVIGRDAEIHRVIQILNRHTKSNPILIGEPGVDKTAVVGDLAQRIVAGDAPESLRVKTLIALNLPAMVAGAKHRGEFEECLKTALAKIQRFSGQVITLVDGLYTVIDAGAGSEGAMDARNMLKPMFTRGGPRVAGATTLGGYRGNVEKDPALERHSQQVFTGEPSAEDTVVILHGTTPKYKVHHKVMISDDAFIATANFSDRYTTGRQLPGKTIDLIDETASRPRMELDSSPAEIDKLRRAADRPCMEEFYLEESDPKHVDEPTQERFNKLRADLVDRQETPMAFTGRREAEKTGYSRVGELRVQLDELHTQSEPTIRENRWEEAGRLQNGEIPAIEHQINEAEAAPGQVDTDSAGPMIVEKAGLAEIVKIIESWTRIPTGKLLQTRTNRPLRMEEETGKRFIGQKKTVQAVSDAVRRSRTGIVDPNCLVGSSLFLGSTGVGKVGLAKTLVKFLFGDERAMVRIDIFEYSERYSVARLVGAPPGYVSYEQGGQLTEAVRRHPYCTILLGKAEGADPEVFDVLLQVLDGGRLADGQGCAVDFRNMILILTSNLGSQFLVGQTMNEEERRGAVMEAVCRSFEPEFPNRLDETVMFDPLSADDLSGTIDLMVADLARRLEDRRIGLLASEPARGQSTRIGCGPVYGIRPLRRIVQKEIGNRLTRMLLAGEIMDGRTVCVDISYELNSLCTEVSESAEAAKQVALGGVEEECLD